jgi:soluble lytic murein transglycosylase-like protein
MKKKILIIAAVLIATISCTSFLVESTITEKVAANGVEVSDSTPSIVMYNSILKYAEIYEVPVDYAFALAYTESRYKGPAHIDYKTKNLKSKSGALGPMQIKLATAKMFAAEEEQNLSATSLKNDIDLNVKISMRIIRYLKDKYGTWGKAFGAYNTGRPVNNEYSKKILNKTYTWVSFS